MGEIIPFKKLRPGERHKGNSLCRHGRHKWLVVMGEPFAVKRGKLVTTYKCARCGVTKTITH